MPRIDPLQLLKCLSVLLTPEGGILSRDEVPRLVNLMTKFSKKLVSKCVYVLILKNTNTELVDMFMAEGGWTLIQTWLQDAVQIANWHLVREILGLLLITPVDVERLKLNILPKLIKSLSRRDDLEDVAELSTQLVKQWLTIVKGSSSAAQQSNNDKVESVKSDDLKFEKENLEAEDDNLEAISTSTFYKKDTKETSDKDKIESNLKDVPSEKTKLKDEDKKSSSRSSSSKSSSRDKDRSKDKDRNRDKDKRSSSKSSSSSRSKSSSSSSKDKDRKDRDREKDRHRDRSRDNKDKDKERDKHRNNGSIKSSSSSSKDKKESSDKKEKEKSDRDKSSSDFKPLEKFGRIPKKSSTEPKETKESLEAKKKFSVGIRKDSEERPKTVKIFHSRMRSTGLEEEAKPAPSRPVKKIAPPSTPIPPPISLKRQSPPKDIKEPVIPPEKKIKIDKVDIPDRPGAIKLIPPKPKPTLLESDLFNDALTAATSKKEPKKRKRRASTSKDTPTSPSTSPAHDQPSTPTTTAPPAGSPLGLKNIAPINFYQDTLSSEDAEGTNDENKENDKIENLDDSIVSTVSETKENDEIRSPRAVTPTEDDPEEIKKLKIDDGLKGVLLYTRKKGPKKTISWKNETDLVEIRYFELDETERVNVTKAFGDMAKMDISNEREAMQLSRKVGGEDVMEPQVVWRIPFEIDLVESLTAPGSRSLEKDIQFAREKSVLQALYFDKRKIPDSPEEPLLENHQMCDPVIIALEDPESQEYDLRSTPWPEPKGNQPLPEPQIPIGFPNMQGPFAPPFNNMPPPAFQNIPNMPPRFPGPNGPMGPPIPNNFGPPNMMPNGNMMGPPNVMPSNDVMMNPNMFPVEPLWPPDNLGPPEPDFMYGNPNGPNNMNMFPPSNNFNNHRHNNNRGGDFRRGRGGNDGGNWVRMSGAGRGNWRRGGNRGGRLCKNVQNHGYCRNRDNCPFIHPQ